MQYLLLIYDQERQWDAQRQTEREQIYQRYFQLVGELTQKGTYIGGNPLQPTATATTVRIRDSKKLVTDGPFAETKEQLGGYFLIEAKDLDEAIAVAARIPTAESGSIEVRPIRPHPTPA